MVRSATFADRILKENSIASGIATFSQLFFGTAPAGVLAFAVPRKRPMPPEERAVCARLLLFRKTTWLSRAAFARTVGMDRFLLASYEAARSQLNYPAAFQILWRFPLLNPAWLAGEEGAMMNLESYITYPSPAEIEYGPRTPFSLVYSVVLKPKILASRTAWLTDAHPKVPLFKLSRDAAGRLRAEDLMRLRLRRWLAYLPDEKLNDYLGKLNDTAEDLLEKYPKGTLHSWEDAQRRIAEAERIQLQMQASLAAVSTRKPKP